MPLHSNSIYYVLTIIRGIYVVYLEVNVDLHQCLCSSSSSCRIIGLPCLQVHALWSCDGGYPLPDSPGQWEQRSAGWSSEGEEATEQGTEAEAVWERSSIKKACKNTFLHIFIFVIVFWLSYSHRVTETPVSHYYNFCYYIHPYKEVPLLIFTESKCRLLPKQ